VCKAFSCIIDQVGTVTWKLGVDSHSDLARLGGYQDRVLGEFAKYEVTPRNGNYLHPDEWVCRVDESPTPSWCGMHEKELVLAAHKQWLSSLSKLLNLHPTVHPFSLTPPTITERHIQLLKEWASVWESVGDSVGASVGDSVGASVEDSVWAAVGASVGASIWHSVWDSVWALVEDSVWHSVEDSVWDSVGASVGDSVGDSVGAYVGTFFKLPKWQEGYPFQSVVDLWEMGLVASFDGATWRLHGGPNGQVLYTISQERLRSSK